MCVSFQVVTHAEAAEKASLSFVCVHRRHYEFLKTTFSRKGARRISNVELNALTPDLTAVFFLSEGTVVLQIDYLVS